MTDAQMKALQRYMSALVYFMLNAPHGIHEFLAAKAALELAFGMELPQLNRPDLPNVL